MPTCPADAERDTELMFKLKTCSLANMTNRTKSKTLYKYIQLFLRIHDDTFLTHPYSSLTITKKCAFNLDAKNLVTTGTPLWVSINPVFLVTFLDIKAIVDGLCVNS